MRAPCTTLSDRLISSGHGGHGAGGRGTAQGRAGAGRSFFLFLFFSLSHMISYHKFGTSTYHTLSKVMISHDKRVAVLPNSFFSFFFSFFFFFFLLGLALPSLGFGPSLSFVLTLGGQLRNYT